MTFNRKDRVCSGQDGVNHIPLPNPFACISGCYHTPLRASYAPVRGESKPVYPTDMGRQQVSGSEVAVLQDANRGRPRWPVVLSLLFSVNKDSFTLSTSAKRGEKRARCLRTLVTSKDLTSSAPKTTRNDLNRLTTEGSLYQSYLFQGRGYAANGPLNR